MDIFEFCLGQDTWTGWFLKISPSIVFSNPSRNSHLLEEIKLFGLAALRAILLSRGNRACGTACVALDAVIGIFHLLSTVAKRTSQLQEETDFQLFSKDCPVFELFKAVMRRKGLFSSKGWVSMSFTPWPSRVYDLLKALKIFFWGYSLNWVVLVLSYGFAWSQIFFQNGNDISHNCVIFQGVVSRTFVRPSREVEGQGKAFREDEQSIYANDCLRTLGSRSVLVSLEVVAFTCVAARGYKGDKPISYCNLPVFWSPLESLEVTGAR